MLFLNSIIHRFKVLIRQCFNTQNNFFVREMLKYVEYINIPIKYFNYLYMLQSYVITSFLDYLNFLKVSN